jgi:hypothetical protein
MAAAVAITTPLPAVAADGVTTVCRFDDARFTEISGMTYSQLHPGVLYLHNDSSGGPRIYAVDGRTCRTLATLTIEGIDARDIEAIGSGRDKSGRPVLWVADVGDNLDSWSEVRLHRVREPKKLRDRTLSSKTYRFTYSDRSHNAETILSDPNSLRVWVVTKQSARGRLYALPDPLSADRVNIARPVRREGAFVTDGSVSPDGTRYVLRDYVDALTFVGLPPGSDPQTVYLPLQLQGEAITWTPDGTALLVAGERDQARFIAHTLRGVSGTLGAAAVQHAAAALETALRTGADAAACEPLIAAVEGAYTVVAGDILAQLPQDECAAAAAAPDGAALRDLVQRLDALLAVGDIAAGQLFRESAGALRVVLGEDLGRLTRQLDAFDYDRARATLSAIRWPDA